MFPDIEAENGGVAFEKRRVLVRGGEDGELAVLHHEPSPAAAESLERGVGELFFEFGERAEGLVDGFGEGAGGFAAAVGRHHEPEERVVEVAADIVAQAGADGFGSGAEVFEEFLGCELGEFGLVGEEFVGVGDVGLVVLVVVDAHRLGIDVRLERFIGIGERREGVGAGRGSGGVLRGGGAG